MRTFFKGMVTIRGNSFVAREGGLKGRRDRRDPLRRGPPEGRRSHRNLDRWASAAAASFRPVLPAGLCPSLKRNDILIADRLLDANGGEMPLELPAGLAAAAAQPGVHCGPLLTADHVVRLPSEKQSLFRRYGAMAVDMETLRRGRGLPAAAKWPFRRSE